MPLFSFQDKWKNILVLSLFFIFGASIIESIHSGAFLLIAIVSSRFIAKEVESRDHYFDDFRMGEYAKIYYFAYYGFLLSVLYVYLAYRQEFKVTLDIAYFLFQLPGAAFLWYSTFFFPADGDMDAEHTAQAILALFFYGGAVLAMLVWMVMNFSGFSWFSPIILNFFNF